MARTKQTARRSTGGVAPIFPRTSDRDNQSSLVQIFTTTSTRTIAVDGEDEQEVEPDIIRMSFEISEERRGSTEAIFASLTKLSEARIKLETVGVSKDNITSDSVSMRERSVILKDGIEVEEDDEESHQTSMFGSTAPKRKKSGTKKGSEKEYISLFNATTILRVFIDGEGLAALFGRVMLSMMEIGLCSFEAPTYSLSTLTDHRNQARCNAVANAVEKAKLMVAALGEGAGVTLGRPISINDIPIDIEDDAASSFISNPWYMSMRESKNAASAGGQVAALTGIMDQFAPETLFSIAPVRINACVRVIFEVI